MTDYRRHTVRGSSHKPMVSYEVPNINQANDRCQNMYFFVHLIACEVGIYNMGHRVRQGTLTVAFLSAFPNEQTDGMLKRLKRVNGPLLLLKL